MKTQTKTPQRKNHKSMTNQELENKIVQKINKIFPQPKTLKENIQQRLTKLK